MAAYSDIRTDRFCGQMLTVATYLRCAQIAKGANGRIGRSDAGIVAISNWSVAQRARRARSIATDQIPLVEYGVNAFVTIHHLGYVQVGGEAA
jgi:hypothetical protein